ncbi:transcription initiation factor IIE, beta subunit [Hypoxylon cercidicola]|nr:transcription initiation factor IIE, beta subunit [Hypoxylon cercidicola]
MSPLKPTNSLKRSAASSTASPLGSLGKGETAKRQKRDGIQALTPTPAAAAAVAASQDFGIHMSTHVTYAVDFLKAKRTPKTLQEILDHLTLQHLPEKSQMGFMLYLKQQSRILFKPAPKSKDQKLPAWRTGTYEFRAKLPGVNTKETLLEYLQKKPDASCTPIKDIKDGWPEFEPAIDQLEKEHKILVQRTKKDNQPKNVWLDDPSLHHVVDPQFQGMWFREKLPSSDDMPRLLNQLGQKATSVPTNNANRNLKAPPKKKKARASNKRLENEHMRGIMEMFEKR